ncbi:hypothetical protein K402DRAFT_426156 [Aulographum hederae CBS 113979]|uniref:Uncharacterized protein n=1 Tax=Aulographum hederae CBS 113979 TaxID=1176131 RepID=A0A6G1GIA2_9PEZI|nr:hypothetical protein K402DRAFT_426156 [Aulographum hederae CBS 113979]
MKFGVVSFCNAVLLRIVGRCGFPADAMECAISLPFIAIIFTTFVATDSLDLFMWTFMCSFVLEENFEDFAFATDEIYCGHTSEVIDECEPVPAFVTFVDWTGQVCVNQLKSLFPWSYPCGVRNHSHLGGDTGLARLW